MLLTAERLRYDMEDVKRLFRQLPRGSRVPLEQSGERLTVQAPPLEEGPGLQAARERADLRWALKLYPDIEHVMIAVQAYGECATHCRTRRTRRHDSMGYADWYDCVGDCWHMTGGDVRGIVSAVLEFCRDRMNAISGK